MVDEAAARARQFVIYHERINAFVLRARRTEAHSLAQDKDALLALVHSTKHVNHTVFPDGTTRTTISWTTPPEEQLESAAARIRPFILKGELVYYGNVLKAIEGLIANAPSPEREFVKKLRDMWKTYDADFKQIRGFELHVENTETGEKARMTDNLLGFAWIYGDTVHHDPDRLRETDAFGLEQRYQAAVPLVAGIMAAAIATLNFIRTLNSTGHLVLAEEMFELPVVVTRTEYSFEAELYSAEVGTPLPEGLEDLPDGWKKFEPIERVERSEDVTPDSPTAESDASSSMEP